MQKWEYGYMYVATAGAAGRAQQFIAISDVSGNRILKNISDDLAALNFLGAQGWIISESPYRTWPVQTGGWLLDLVKRERPETQSIQLYSMHFMRKPQA